VGGGIKDVDMVRDLLRVGADKVVVNSAAFTQPKLISEISKMFGSQCIIASIDVIESSDGYRVVIECGAVVTDVHPVDIAQRYEHDGAGEILITSIPQDGTMQGYDTGLIRQVSDAISVPVIASGGAGDYEHMYEALTEGKANAVASSAMYHFTQQTPREAKLYLRDKGVPVRL
jgi:cyclase